VDPRGIQGGSKLKTGDPGFFSIVKTRGSIETTIPFYKIKKGKEGDNEGHARLEGLQGRGGVMEKLPCSYLLEFYQAPRIPSYHAVSRILPRTSDPF